MLGNLSTTILIAILLYHSLQYYKEWRIQKSVNEYRNTKKSPVATQPTTNNRSPHIVKISENAYVAIGYALGNSIMLIGKTGLVIIDTTESFELAATIFKEFRKISDKPVQGIIYTHNHADHVLGTKAFIGRNYSDDIQIWAHHTLMDIYLHSFQTVGTAHYIRSMHQFGGTLNDDQVSDKGYGSRLSVGMTDDTWIVPPNKLLYTKEKDITLAGINLRLLHIPGETDDQIAVYWPDENLLFCGDDFYRAFPNLYAIRGTPFRSLKLWYESLDIMRHLHAEKLVSSHAEPVFGREKVYRVLTDYRDAVQIVHDQTVRYLNLGLHPDEIAEKIRLPKALREKSYLQEHYGTLKWSSKGLFAGYMGWFSGDIADLNPHTPDEQAKRLVKLAGGIEHVLKNAQDALNEDDPQWALRLSSYALRYDSTNQKAREIKAKSLFDLAELQTSMNGHNYYVTSAQTTLGNTQIKVDPGLRKKLLRKASIKDLFRVMAVRFKMEECQHLDQVVEFSFPDVKQSVTFHVRNGVMDLSGKYERSADVKVKIGSVHWREILSGAKSGLVSALTSELTVEPGLGSLQEIMSCVEKN